MQPQPEAKSTDVSEAVSAAAARSANAVPDQADAETSAAEKRERRISNHRSPSERADHHHDQLVDSLNAQIRWLKDESARLATVIAQKDLDLKDYSRVREDLATLRGSRWVRRIVQVGCAIGMGIGTVLMATFPPGTEGSWLGVTSHHAFCIGAGLTILSSILVALLAVPE